MTRRNREPIGINCKSEPVHPGLLQSYFIHPVGLTQIDQPEIASEKATITGNFIGL